MVLAVGEGTRPQAESGGVGKRSVQEVSNSITWKQMTCFSVSFPMQIVRSRTTRQLCVQPVSRQQVECRDSVNFLSVVVAYCFTDGPCARFRMSQVWRDPDETRRGGKNKQGAEKGSLFLIGFRGNVSERVHFRDRKVYGQLLEQARSHARTHCRIQR